MRPLSHPSRRRGFTLIEVMVSLGILSVGLLSMARLQAFGLHSNQGARATMRATQLAEELRGGMDLLAYGDAAFTASGTSGNAAPTVFGTLLFAGTSPPAHAWSDSTPMPGVTLDSALERDPVTGGPLYQRRWTVWDYSPAPGSTASAKVVAISVLYSERGSGQREVVLYTQKVNVAGILNNVALQR
jgi:prepilin-type N-terminal cleavage/methylation domain-containing protein